LRISGQEIVSGKNKVSIRPAHLSSGKQHSGVKNTGDSLSVRLTRIFMDKGLDVPPSQIHALETGLSALGMTSSEIDNNNAFRALLLQRHSIPFTRELLNNTWENESAIFKNVASLEENAISLLDDGHLVGENRNAVESLVRDISALFSGEVSPESMKFVMEDIIDLWAYDLESKLLLLVEGRSESVSDNSDVRFSEVELTIESLLNSHSRDFVNHKTASFIEQVRNAVQEIRSLAHEVDFRQPGAVELLREAVDTFSSRLSVIAGEYKTLFNSMSENQQLSILIAELFEKNVRLLENRLLSQLLICTSESDFNEITGGFWRTLSLKNIIQKSGMGFEWQLLAWYRSGRDPWRFHELLRNDLKGILICFINRSKIKTARGGIKKKLQLLEKQSQTLLKNITNRQLGNILNEHDEKRRFCLGLPLSAESKQGYARIVAKGNKEPEKNTLDPQNFTLSFEVETSKIGMVNVFMTVSGKTVLLRFELEDKNISALGLGMKEEIRQALTARGFMFGRIEFCERNIGLKRHDKRTTSTDTGKSTRNLDIVG